MSLDYCTECQTLEGKWEESKDSDGNDIEVCGECGSEECRMGIPEHDDWDMER